MGNLELAFPDIGNVAPLRLLGEGFRSFVIGTAEGIVFRIGKNAHAAEGYTREGRRLPVLRPHLPVPVPSPQWYVMSSDKFPFGAMGYPKLRGRSLTPGLLSKGDEGGIATGIARFMLALH